jgi:hypothetical protein
MTNSTRPRENLRGGKGNFANDPQRASEAGRKGGQNSHSRSDSQHSRHAASEGGSQSSNKSSSDKRMDDDEEG